MTFPELIRGHFTYSNTSGGYEAALSGNSSLLFLPGAHTLDKNIYFYTSGNHSLTIAALDETCSLEDLKVNISCEDYNNIRLEGFGEVSLACLNLYSCVLVCHSSSLLSVDQVFLNGALVRANSTKASFTNIKVGPHEESERNGQLRMRFTEGGTVSNVVFAQNTQLDTNENGLLHVHDSSDVTITNCTFSNNANPIESRGIVHLHSSRNVNFTDCHFYDNQKTAIFAIDSTFRVSGNMTFQNNTAYEGGAVSLINAQMEISNFATLLFERNSAQHVGGGIFSTANTAVYTRIPEPFCPLLFTPYNSTSLSSTIEFIDNTAVEGGSAVYGITLSQLLCLKAIQTLDPVDALNEAMSITPDEPSAVSGDASRVCICQESVPDCLTILPKDHAILNYTVYPGQNFTISAAVMGLNFAPTSGSVFANFIDSDASLTSELQRVQRVTHTGCSDLRYSVKSNRQQETLVLVTDGRIVASFFSRIEGSIELQNRNNFEEVITSETVSNNPPRYYSNGTFRTDLADGIFKLAGNVVRYLQIVPVFISVTLLDCPPGFILSGDPGQCTCDPVLLENNVTCNIDDQTVRRYGTTWVNAIVDGNESGVIVHLHCPFDYCRPEAVDVNLTKPDTQCAFNRSGTLCGACKPGLSLALGSPQCLQCSNRNISLLIVFALAGLALVFLIKVLNITVAEGTINGLIFYANIVKASESVFFPAVHSKFLPILSVFISWLNLDFGIESCFFDGMDGYAKTWLQFLFPVYIWIIAASIIIASHYSTRATKIFGSSSVPVLATLILISYAKLLRTLIAIFAFSSLEYPSGARSTVWAFDGNLSYNGGRHIALLLLAIIIVLLLCLPYTVILLCAGWHRRYFGLEHKRFQWLIPFLDAYFGPLKDKRQYWIGVLLVVRGVLFVFFASFFSLESNVNLLLIIVAIISLFVVVSLTGKVYKKLYITILEHSFFVNLGVLAAGTLFINASGGNQEALVIISVGIAFLQFCGIVAFHSYRFVISPLWSKVRKRRSEDLELRPIVLEAVVPQEYNTNKVTQTTVSVSEMKAEDKGTEDKLDQSRRARTSLEQQVSLDERSSNTSDRQLSSSVNDEAREFFADVFQ